MDTILPRDRSSHREDLAVFEAQASTPATASSKGRQDGFIRYRRVKTHGRQTEYVFYNDGHFVGTVFADPGEPERNVCW